MIVRVWDAPTRVFHWSLAVCFIGLIVSAQIGGAAMAWHFRLGFTVLTLLLWRLIWGFQGGVWSRFASFVYSPAHSWQFLRGTIQPHDSVGHNPLGAWSVIAMLGFLLLQVSSGMLSDDEISASGPLTRFVSESIVGYATFYHRQIGKLMLLFLVVMHLCAIAIYFFKKHENLVKPMIFGDKTLDFKAPSSSDTSTDRRRAATILIACAAFVALGLQLVA
jgi:cytochrome b